MDKQGVKRYRLLKDLPTFKAGQECWIGGDGSLWTEVLTGDRIKNPTMCWKENIVMYNKRTLDKFPNILKDWFKKIPEQPKTVWDLEYADECWMLDINLEPLKVDWRDAPYDIRLRELGLIYLTKEELLVKQARSEAEQILLRDTKGFKPDWKSHDYGWNVIYNPTSYKFFANTDYNHLNDGTLRFSTEEDAKASIENHEKEWKIYLGVEE